MRGPLRAALRGTVLATALVPILAGVALADPLGNFTINHYAGIRVEPERVLVDVVSDEAEIPTFQTRQAIDTDHAGTVGPAEAASWRDRECPRLADGLRAAVDGRALALSVAGSALTFPKGVGGLETLRLLAITALPLSINLIFLTEARVDRATPRILAITASTGIGSLVLGAALGLRAGELGIAVGYLIAHTVTAIILTVQWRLSRRSRG